MIPLGDDGFRSVVWKLLAISTRTHNQTNSTLRQVVHCLFLSSLTKPGSRTEIAPKFQKPHTRPSLPQLFRSRSAPLRRPRPRPRPRTLLLPTSERLSSKNLQP